MTDLINQINNTFEIREDLLVKINTENELINLLSLYVQELINKDFEHLLWLLYKIDVGEKKVKQAILDSDPETAHITIAKMIIEREKQKIETRKKYSANKDNTDWIF